VYPNRTPALEALCGAVLRVLAASREKAPGTGGRSIGVAQLADGSFMIAVSGKTDDAIFIEKIIGAGIGAAFDGQPVRYASTEVVGLKLAPPLTGGRTDASKKCAMPKLYKGAENVGIPVAAPTEVWWDGGRGAANPCPDKDDKAYMYPCEFCAWNAPAIQGGAAWH